MINDHVVEGAPVKHGVVYDPAMGESIRVTVIATGLGNREAKPQLTMVQSEARKTGTDNAPALNPEDYDTPAIWRSNRGRSGTTPVAAGGNNIDMDIPAFLRRQAD